LADWRTSPGSGGPSQSVLRGGKEPLENLATAFFCHGQCSVILPTLERRDPSQARLVIFDLDGTLVDTLEATFRCFQEAVAPTLGRVPSREEILDRFGPADHRIVSEWVGEGEAKAAVERLYACYETAFRDSGPFPGMVDLVLDLRRAGRRTAIFTGRGRASTEAIVRGMKLEGLFDAIVCGDEIEHPKPAPDGLLKILEMLNTQREDAIYVGDTVKDMEAARRAGVAMIAALWGSPESPRLEAQDTWAATSTNDLKRLLSLSRSDSK
jgi:HAD superfamily hydrolase (TIGR01549 family)